MAYVSREEVKRVSIYPAAIAFGSELGDENWNPAADLNNDNVVDIYDVVTVASNFVCDTRQPTTTTTPGSTPIA